MAYRLAAAAKGFSPAQAQQGKAVRVEPGGSASTDIVLGTGGANLAGVASEASGRAIPGAEIRLVHWQPPWIALGVRADAAGRYEEWVSEGAWTISGIADGYASSGVAVVAPSDDASVVLTPGGMLKGVVKSEADGQPIAGIEVMAKLLAQNRRYVLSTLADDDGSFVLRSLEAGNYLVRAAGQGLRGEISFISVAPHQQPASVSIPVRGAVRVSGRVIIGSQSTPCEEGSVVLGAPEHDVSPRRGTTAFGPSARAAQATPAWGPNASTQITTQGYANFESMAPGRYYATVECRDHVFASGPEVIEVGERDVQGLVWRVEPGVGIDVQAVDEGRHPVAGAEVWLDGPTDEPDVASTSLPLPTDGAGRYTMPRELKPGVYTLKGDWTHHAKPVLLDLRHATGTVPATLVLDGSAAIALTVREADGRPADDLSARAYPARDGPPENGLAAFVLGTPLGGGRYRIGPLEPGGYTVEVTDRLNPPVRVGSGNSTTLSVAAGSMTTASLALARTARITGRIVDRAGKGAAAVWVTLMPPTRSSAAGPDPLALERSPRSRELSDEAGRFVFSAITPGASFTVLAEGADSFAVQRDVRSGAIVTLALQAAGALNGTVSLPDGSPADDFNVQVVEAEAGIARGAEFVHANGRFSLSGVAPGEIGVIATTAAGYFARAQLSLAAGQIIAGVHLQLVAPKAQSIAVGSAPNPAL